MDFSLSGVFSHTLLASRRVKRQLPSWFIQIFVWYRLNLPYRFQEFVSHPIGLTINEPDTFQALVFEESVIKRCIPECHSCK